MKHIWTILIVFILSLNTNQFVFSQSQPKAWYVYKNATGLNNGTSWQNAWTSFASINWNNILPGDTLYISGGNDSLIYSEKLVIEKKMGQPDKYITITNGKTPGHNGKVILDGNWTLSLIIDIRGSQYIRVEKITIKKSNLIVRRADNPTTASRCIILDSITVLGVGAKGGIALGGYPTLGLVDSVIVQNCTIIHNEVTSIETDLISVGYAKNVFIRNNYLYHYNNNDRHSDAIQFQNMNTNVEISGNYVEHVRPTNPVANYADNMLMINMIDGVIKIFNNVFNYRTHISWFNVILHGYYSDAGQLHIYNNTFIGKESHNNVITTNITDSVFVKNNIFYDERVTGSGSDYPLFAISNTVPAANLNNNLFYNPNGYPYLYSYNGYNRTLSQLRSSGAELNSIQGQNPLFVDFNNKDYRLQSTSPAKDVGANLSSFFNIDKNGVTRPQSSAWDIGAYEYVDGGLQGDNIAPEVVSAQIVDSITVRVVFSEPLEQSSANNPNNYSIDNGININSVQFSGVVATLNTSVHSPGFYNIIVSNVSDTAGNIISTQNNSAIYGYNPDPINQLIKFVPARAKASAIPEPQHTPEKTFDGLGYNSGDPSTRWAAQYLPQWIVYDMGDIRMINKTRIQYFRWLEGRIYTYSILVSTDSLNWTTVKQNIQSGPVEWNEEIFGPIPARYVKILVTGNNESDWANIWETEIYGQLMVSNNDDTKNIPSEFVLNQNYPNPFNPSTTISWQSPVSGWQTLKVYDMLGNEVVTLVDEYREAGSYNLQFTINNLQLTSGVYFYQLRIGNPSTSSGSLSGSEFSTSSGSGQAKQSFVETKKMILLK